MSKPGTFLSADDEQEIVVAIGIAEKNTSGEIRVHIEQESTTPPMERAIEIFEQLKMQHTKERNGVLFYVAVGSKQFAICGDEGIDKKVPADFWDSTKDVMMTHFRKGAFKQGLVDGILQAGEQLKAHFPHQDDDQDELSNEISKG
ncbi:MAG: hypothetical protein RL427_1422 [Bacteroidota bacterium]|jgi:uncharacterized membrane protein